MKTDLDEKIRDFEKARNGESDFDPSLAASNKSKSRIATEIIVAPLFFGFIGYLLDGQFGTVPLWSLILFFGGFATGIYNAWRASNGYSGDVGLKKEGKKTQQNEGP